MKSISKGIFKAYCLGIALLSVSAQSLIPRNEIVDIRVMTLGNGSKIIQYDNGNIIGTYTASGTPGEIVKMNADGKLESSTPIPPTIYYDGDKVAQFSSSGEVISVAAHDPTIDRDYTIQRTANGNYFRNYSVSSRSRRQAPRKLTIAVYTDYQYYVDAHNGDSPSFLRMKSIVDSIGNDIGTSCGFQTMYPKMSFLGCPYFFQDFSPQAMIERAQNVWDQMMNANRTPNQRVDIILLLSGSYYLQNLPTVNSVVTKDGAVSRYIIVKNSVGASDDENRYLVKQAFGALFGLTPGNDRDVMDPSVANSFPSTFSAGNLAKLKNAVMAMLNNPIGSPAGVYTQPPDSTPVNGGGGSSNTNGGSSNGGSSSSNGGSSTTNSGSSSTNGGSSNTNGGSSSANGGSSNTNGGTASNNGSSSSDPTTSALLTALLQLMQTNPQLATLLQSLLSGQ